MIKSCFALLALLAHGQGATITVCSSGCTYSTLQDAWDNPATTHGDIIEIKAGTTLVGNPELVRPLVNMTIRSSFFHSLPVTGRRISPTVDFASMATLTPVTPSNSILTIGNRPQYIHAVDTATDYMTFDIDNSLQYPANGEVVTCAFNPATGVGSMPDPLVIGTRYWVRDRDGAGARTFKLAASPLAAAINITSAGSAGGSYYYQPFCTMLRAPRNLTIQGLIFTGASAGATPPIAIGSNGQAQLGAGVSGVMLDHVIVSEAFPACTGPGVGVGFSDGSNHTLRDSFLQNLCSDDGVEVKGFSVINTDGVSVVNSQIEGATIGFLVGGQYDAGRANARRLHVTGNYDVKPGNLKYWQGAGAPPFSDCYYEAGSGEFFRDISASPNTCANGACWRCQADGTWLQTTDEAEYRSAYTLNKNGFELKECADCIIEGNLIVGSFQSRDAGQGIAGGCVPLYYPSGGGGGGPWVQCLDVIVRNNKFKRTWRGLFARYSDEPLVLPQTWQQYPLQNINFTNNVLERIGEAPQLQQFALASDGPSRFAMSTSAAMSAGRFANNTMRLASGASTNQGFIWGSGNDPLVGPYSGNVGSLFSANLYATTAIPTFVDQRSGVAVTTCAGWITYFGATLQNNVAVTAAAAGSLDFNGSGCGPVSTNFIYNNADPLYVSATNSRLQAGSPYSASNMSATLLSPNGADMGADVDAVEQFSSPAEAGVSPMAISVLGRPAGGVVIKTPLVSCTVSLYGLGSRIASNLLFTSTAATGSHTFASLTGQYQGIATCGTSYRVWIGAR